MEQTQHILVHYEMSGFEGLLFEGGRSEVIAVDFATHTCHCQCLTMQVRPHRMFTGQAKQYTGAVTGLITSTPVLWS